MYRIGITGGIGSGKSTITKAFRSLGVKVYLCDVEAQRLMRTNDNIISGLKSLFGSDVYNTDGTINKPLMSSIIFENKEILNDVNDLIHPIVAQDFNLWAKKREELGDKYVICEAAVMINSPLESVIDKIIVSHIPFEQRVARTIERDCSTREKVMARIKNQVPDDVFTSKADFLISPDDQHFILPQILFINTELSK